MGHIDAQVLAAPRTLAPMSRRPELKPGEALVRVDVAGVCGTDLAIYSGDYPVPLPRVLGHEFVGTVEDVVGDSGHGWAGQRVVCEINDTCRSRGAEPCPACAADMPTHCHRRVTLGIDGWEGAFATHVVAPVANLHAVPDAITSDAAVFVEPLAAAFQTFEMTPVAEGEWVVVLGAGRLGVLVCAAAAALGARVLAVARKPSSLDRARAMGADEACSAGEAAARIRQLTGGLMARLVVEATGTADGVSRALELVRPRGTVALKTTCGLPPPDLDLTRAVVNEIRFAGSRCGPFPKALDALATGAIPVESLVEARFPLGELGLALDAARSRAKVLIYPSPKSRE
ncbi:MAG TPA: alcohol dehydrogenase catalytic domain-containing protein [Armatimonadota bacterium]|nr:alcohol dehydrogenase catalytic domain-containing protein [Armatimonadota bacterium]